MTVYPDASLIVAAFADEASSEMARAWIAGMAGLISTSGWCEAEAASALAIKVRTGALDAMRYDAVVGLMQAWRSATTDIPVASRHFATATRFVARRVKPLRASDALHLAITADAGATLWTLDRPMAGAGQALGLDVRLLA